MEISEEILNKCNIDINKWRQHESLYNSTWRNTPAVLAVSALSEMARRIASSNTYSRDDIINEVTRAITSPNMQKAWRDKLEIVKLRKNQDPISESPTLNTAQSRDGIIKEAAQVIIDLEKKKEELGLNNLKEQAKKQEEQAGKQVDLVETPDDLTMETVGPSREQVGLVKKPDDLNAEKSNPSEKLIFLSNYRYWSPGVRVCINSALKMDNERVNKVIEKLELFLATVDRSKHQISDKQLLPLEKELEEELKNLISLSAQKIKKANSEQKPKEASEAITTKTTPDTIKKCFETANEEISEELELRRQGRSGEVDGAIKELKEQVEQNNTIFKDPELVITKIEHMHEALIMARKASGDVSAFQLAKQNALIKQKSMGEAFWAGLKAIFSKTRKEAHDDLKTTLKTTPSGRPSWITSHFKPAQDLVEKKVATTQEDQSIRCRFGQ